MAPLPDPPQNNENELDGESRPISFGQVIVSSDEDEIANNGYQPLPQEEEQNDLSSLLTALNTYGVNTIPDEEATCIREDNELEGANENEMNSAKLETQCSLTKDMNEAHKEHQKELAKEQGQIWHEKNEPNISLTAEKEAEIKRAMSGFTLPANNVPQWAFDVSEEEWRYKISTITGS